MRAHLYFVVQCTSNLPEAAWQRLTDFFDSLPGTPETPAHRLHKRTSLDGSSVIYEANFDTEDLQFERFRSRLVSALRSPDNRVSFTSETQRFDARDTAYLTFKYQETPMFRLALFGCSSDTGLCTYEESHQEALAYLRANLSEWEVPEA